MGSEKNENEQTIDKHFDEEKGTFKDNSSPDDDLSRQVEKIESLEGATPIVASSDELSGAIKKDGGKDEAVAVRQRPGVTGAKDSSEVHKMSHTPSRRLMDSQSEASIHEKLKVEEKAKKLEDIKQKLASEPSKDGRSSLRVGLIVVSVLALIGFGLAAWLYMQPSSADDELTQARAELSKQQEKYNKDIRQAKGDQEAIKKKMDDVKKKAAAEAVKQERSYRTIPEWNVRFKLNEKNKDLVFSYEVLDNGSGGSAEHVLISTKSLSLERTPQAVDKRPYACGPASGASGFLSRLNESEYQKIKNESSEDLGYKKVGEHYYIWGTMPGYCSQQILVKPENGSLIDNIKKSQEVAKELPQLLEEIK